MAADKIKSKSKLKLEHWIWFLFQNVFLFAFIGVYRRSSAVKKDF